MAKREIAPGVVVTPIFNWNVDESMPLLEYKPFELPDGQVLMETIPSGSKGFWSWMRQHARSNRINWYHGSFAEYVRRELLIR